MAPPLFTHAAVAAGARGGPVPWRPASGRVPGRRGARRPRCAAELAGALAAGPTGPAGSVLAARPGALCDHIETTLEGDLLTHVRKERELLFPAAMRMAAARPDS